MFGVNDWLRCRLMGLVVCTIVAGFVATNLKSYRDAVNALKSTILYDALPLIGSNIYSEVQADLIRPVFIFSQMANDTIVKDWLLVGERDSARGALSRCNPREIRRIHQHPDFGQVAYLLSFQWQVPPRGPIRTIRTTRGSSGLSA
jgi:hypothetical protein